ncbi:MAG: PIG-L deacetylase family protein [Microthrixaceae bacterium]
MSTIVFLHAHPDDEAIFTGGTMARLSDAGHRVVLVVATGGELGRRATGSDPLDATRRAETERAAELLGARRVAFLGHRDSGMEGDAANHATGSFWSAQVPTVAAEVATLLRAESADGLVVYDPHGIYGHPDHVQGHRIGVMAAELAGVRSLHEMTVDREYLHFVETHLVEEAALGGDLGLARSRIGYASVEIDVVVDVRSQLDRKRAAMAAHLSQLPGEAPVFALDDTRFADVYGWEWFVRRGDRGAIDELAAR